MTDPIKIDLGTWKGRIYWLRARAEPDYNNPNWFMATVYHEGQNTGENIQVARVDCSHNYTHFDRLYKRSEPKDPVSWDLWKAIDELKQNWQTYAKGHENK